jgi:hypothetical protein
MKIKVQRFLKSDDFTIGKAFIDESFECYILEDEFRSEKVMHETRIPSGTYEIKLREFGGHHDKYKLKFPEFHKGMLWLQGVPKFKDILIHIGNSDEDTSGCLLTGKTADLVKGWVGQSTQAYIDLYKKVAPELVKGNKVFIEIKDEL